MTTSMFKGTRVFVAGHKGMVGSAIVRRLATEDCDILTATRGELDLLDQAAVWKWMEANKPDIIFLAAAKVGGIFANATFPAEFLYENAVIATNVIHSAHRCGVKYLFNLGSSCIYPKLASQPIEEESLLSGPLEQTNEAYAIAKIMALKLTQSYNRQYGRCYISGMPCNLYGLGDSYDAQNSHVLPALIRKAHEAKLAQQASIVVWGSGTPYREFLFADDCADACIFLMQSYRGDSHINIGSGDEISIADLANMVCEVVNYKGNIVFDRSKPDGTPRKIMSNDHIRALGWHPKMNLREGIAAAYHDFRTRAETRI